MTLIPYTWNLPKNVSKDAKYAVRRNKGKMEVGLLFRTDYDEEWSLSNGEHPGLVKMVNAVKLEATGNEAGSFYINEYRQVVVPAANGSEDYYYAGEYQHDLEFLFEGKVISGKAVDAHGFALKPGDIWEGVHPGIPYVLKAGGKDISFKHPIRPNVSKEEKLSKYTSTLAAAELAARIRSTKGFNGGRFYVNEHCHIFAPLNSENGINYLYVGDLRPTDPWFPKWQPSAEKQDA